jgi:hypothetical protein
MGVLRVLSMLALFAFVAACQSAAAKGESEAERCADCHITEYRNAKSPVHVGSKPTTCGICHAQTGWRPHVLSHPWPLTGAHEHAKCAFCHTGEPPKFHGTKKECMACHKPDYDRAPEHVARKFSANCTGCYTTTAWTDLLEHPTEPIPPMPSGHPPPPPKPPPPKPKPSVDVQTHPSPRGK